MDKYTKFILTIIAFGVIAINIKIYDLNFVNKANATIHNYHTHTTNDLTLFRDTVIDIITSCKVYKREPEDGTFKIGYCN